MTKSEMFVRCPIVIFPAKKKNGQTVKGGIYLDDLNDEPEIAALYLYSRNTCVYLCTVQARG